MSYCSQSDIEAEINPTDLIAITDDAGTGTLNTTILNQVIQNASDFIDGKVANIYDVPFSPVPVSVKSMSVTITCYRLYRRRLVPDEKNIFYDDYKDVVDFLNKVNMGELHIDLTAERAFEQVVTAARGTLWASAGSNDLFNSM